MSAPPVHDVFVSYAEPDRAWVEGYLLDALKAAGLAILSETAFELGRPRLLEFERAVHDSRRTLLVISQAYLSHPASEFVDLLAQQYSMDTGTWPVIPLLRERADLPDRLAMLEGLDATSAEAQERALARLVDLLGRSIPAPETPPRPYPGMWTFAESDAPMFHGRDAEIDELLQRLRAQRDRAQRLIAVIGPSGSGKSSLVFAGLISALRRSTLFGTGDWTVVSLRPGRTPMDSMSSVLAVTGSGQAVDSITSPESGRLLLIVDQFEELFTVADPAQRRPFQERLAEIAAFPACFVILTARADFYEDLMASPLWRLIGPNRQEILPLDEAGLREAIVKPAEQVDVYVEAALVERLVDDAAGEPGVLPLVQETLVLLWERLERRYLPLRVYEALVPRGFARNDHRNGLQVAVARHAGATLAELSPEQQAIARRVFLGLVQPNVGRADTRRQRTVEELRSADDDPAGFAAVLEHLARNRLLTLTAGDDGTARRVDLAHEALIDGWPWLAELVSAHREATQVKDRLDAKVADWVRLGRERGGLLDAIELAEAEAWRASQEASAIGYGPDLPNLLSASRAELARETQRLQRRLYGAGIFGILALAAFAVALIFYNSAQNNANALTVEVAQRSTAEARAEQQAGTAEAERNRAHTEQLMAVSGNLLDDQLELAALLALESNNISDTPETRAAIAAALDANPYFAGYLQGDSESGYSLAYSPNGQTLAVARNGGVDLRDGESGDPLGPPLLGHYGPVNTITFSPDGKLLATGGEDGKVRLWNVPGGQPLGNALEGHDASVESLAFSPDGRNLVSGDFSGMVILWNVESRRMVGEPITYGAEVTSVAFSPDSEIFAVGGDYGSVRVFSRVTRRQVGELITNSNQVTYSTALAFSSSPSPLLASGDSDGRIRLWDITSGEQVGPALSGHRGIVGTVAFSSDGKILASGGYDGTVRLWNADSMQPIGEPHRAHGRIVACIAFRPAVETGMLASSGDDGRVVFWTVEPHNRLTDPVAQLAAGGVNVPAPDLIYSPDGTAVISPMPAVTFWDAGETQEARRSLSIPFFVSSLVLNPKQPDMLAAGGFDGDIVLWNARTNQAIGPALPGHAGDVRAIAFSSDGMVLASGGLDGTVRIWDLRRKAPLGQPITGYADAIDSVAFSPTDPNLLAFGGTGGTLVLWDIESGRPIGEPLEGHTGRVQSIAFQPDGQFFATGSSDGTVRLWRVSPTQALGVLRIEDASAVLAVAVSPDGRVLAAADANGSVHLWDIPSREPLAPPLAGHSEAALSLAFSPDSTRLVSGGVAGDILVWDIDIVAWRDRACALAGRNLTDAEWEEYFPGTPYHETCSQFPSGADTGRSESDAVRAAASPES